jgi:hypothetical protein
VPGEFARDGDRDDGAALAAPLERIPAGVETPGASVDAGTDGGRCPCRRRARVALSRSCGRVAS